MEKLVLATRQRILTLVDYGLYQPAQAALEFLLLNEPCRPHRHWTDYYRYCVALEQASRHTTLLSVINAFHRPPIYPEPTADQFIHLKFILFESLRMRALKSTGLVDYSNKVAKALIAHLPAAGEIAQDDHPCLPPGYYPQYDPEVLRSAALSHLAANLREEGKLPEWRHNSTAARQLSQPDSSTLANLRSLGPTFAEISTLFEDERYFETLLRINQMERECYICPPSLIEIKAACQSETHELADLYLLSLDTAQDYPGSALSCHLGGLQALLNGDKDTARKQFTLATEANRFYIPAWLALGNSYAAMGDHEQAQSCYARIIRQIDDQCIPALVAMASEYLRVTKPLLASPYLSMALAIDPHHADILNELGVMFYQRGDLKLALEAFHKALPPLSDRWSPRRITIETNLMMTQVKLAIATQRLCDLRRFVRSWLDKDHLDPSPTLLRIASLLIPDLAITHRSRAINTLSKRTPSNRFRPRLLTLLHEQFGPPTQEGRPQSPSV